jgi:hypothetical protein
MTASAIHTGADLALLGKGLLVLLAGEEYMVNITRKY